MSLRIREALPDAAEDWLRDRGVSEPRFMIRPGNATVAGFYDRLPRPPRLRIHAAHRPGHALAIPGMPRSDANRSILQC